MRHTTHLQQLTGPGGNLAKEVEAVGPLLDTIGLDNVLRLDALEHLIDVELRVAEVLHTDNTLQDDVRLTVTGGVHHTRAVDEVQALHQSDVLPDLRRATGVCVCVCVCA